MKTIYEQRCRICGCDWNHACNDHDYWFVEDVCSTCAEKMKPILFNTPMVRAILDGRKTATRRVIKPQPEPFGKALAFKSGIYATPKALVREAPYIPGDVLYVRETFAKNCWGTGWPWLYKASPEYNEYEPDGWHPSIHMPKEAARIFLRVTDVRAERLQDMFASDVSNEGIYFTCHKTADEMIKAFSQLWDTTVKKADRDKYGWAANPWVWVITFERIGKLEENADA